MRHAVKGEKKIQKTRQFPGSKRNKLGIKRLCFCLRQCLGWVFLGQRAFAPEPGAMRRLLCCSRDRCFSPARIDFFFFFFQEVMDLTDVSVFLSPDWAKPNYVGEKQEPPL